jgi:hypothetical protein
VSCLLLFTFQSHANLRRSISKQWGSTTNIEYLKDTQQLLSSWSNKNNIINNEELQDILNTYKEIKSDTGFCEKYFYIDWEHAKFLNTNPFFLQIMSIYNLASPLLSLFLPIILLVIPFFILKVKGLEITLDQYTTILKKLIGDHAIGKIFTKFNDVDIREKAYILVSAAFYLFSIYQNILTCIRFYSNFTKIHNYIFKLRKYIEYTINSMNYYLLVSNNLTSYNLFNNEVICNKTYLENMLLELNKISDFSISIKKVFEILVKIVKGFISWLWKAIKESIAQVWTLLGFFIAWLTLTGTAQQVVGMATLIATAIWLVTIPLREDKE